MKLKTDKTVLIIDDEPRMSEMLKDRFVDYNSRADRLYTFEVDTALTADECVEKARKNIYDIIVLDVMLGGETNGLEVSFGLQQQLGLETPIRIILTGHPDFKQCVESMRQGAWDYIVKEDIGNKPVAQVVVDSVLARLQHLNLRREQEKQIAVNWLPHHIKELQARYGGQFVALWQEQDVEVIASGRDAFELAARLRDWRAEHARQEQPLVVHIPLQQDN